jgi:hypothetical protein
MTGRTLASKLISSGYGTPRTMEVRMTLYEAGSVLLVLRSDWRAGAMGSVA